MAYQDSKEWNKLKKLLTRSLEKPHLKPLLWIGAGSSIAAGYPSTEQVIQQLSEYSLEDLPEYGPWKTENAHLPLDSPQRSYEVWIQSFINGNGEGELADVLEEELL